MAEANPSIEQYRAKDAWFTPSNLISAMRAMLVLPAVMAIVANLKLLVASIFIVAFITDLLDGLIARKTNSVSEIGKIVDPLADKIFVGCVVIAMAAYAMIPLWFLAIILVRDAIILAAGIWAKRKLGVVLPSNYAGKVAVVSIALPLLLVFLNVNADIIRVFEYVSVVLMLMSLGVYGQRLAGLLRATRSTRA